MEREAVGEKRLRDTYETYEPHTVCRPCLRPDLNNPTVKKEKKRRNNGRNMNTN